MNIHNITFDYYSKLLCVDLRTINKDGIMFNETILRDEEVKGFGCKFTIYAFISNDKNIITYSPKYHSVFHELKNKITKENIIESLKEKFPKIVHRIIFEYNNIGIDTKDARKLINADYPAYERFFLKMYPKADISDGWLSNYFFQKVNKGYMFGYFVEEKLVCISDAPDMPYDEDIIQHTGIATLKEYRKQGYAKATASLAAKELIKMGVCPQWETLSNNVASINLAKSIGYVKIADAYIMEEYSL